MPGFEDVRHVDIKGYEGLYAVTEDFRIWSYKNKKFLKPVKTSSNTERVSLSKNGKKCQIWIYDIFCKNLYAEDGENTYFIFKD